LNEIDEEKETTTQSSNKENIPPSLSTSAPTSTPQAASQNSTGTGKRRRRGKTTFRAKPKGKMQGTQTYVKKKTTNDHSRKRRKAATVAEEAAIAQKSMIDEAFTKLSGLKFSEQDQRRLISDYYLQVLHAPPPDEWRGEGGTISDVIGGLKLKESQRRTVEKVLIATHHSLLKGEEYEPSRKSAPKKRFIEDGSKEQQLVADYREQGLSYTETTMLINRWCF
jgi:hypothetical protein